MIDLHTHTLLSDGVLLPTELAQRARTIGYRGLAITDHVDASNLEDVIEKLLKFTSSFPEVEDFTVIAGVELTHIDPGSFADMVADARSLGAKIIVCHGETIVEPVAKGTNMAAIEAGADILAHPGLVTEAECKLASKKGVRFEITSRGGHSLTNGHVASMAKKYNVELILNTDSHAPGDLITLEQAERVALGSGLDIADFRRMNDNAQKLLDKVSN